MEINYYIDNIKFRDLGIYVSKSTGIVDALKTKQRAQFDWYEAHGTITDTGHVRYESRTIVLDCFIKAQSAADFMTKALSFNELIKKSGIRQLRVEIDPAKPLVFMVICDDSINFSKRWSASKMVGTFQLKLIEPNPVKKLIEYVGSKATINISTAEPVSIYWGDGSADHDIFGADVLLNKSYTVAGKYYIVIAGVIEDIINFNSNGTVLWQKY